VGSKVKVTAWPHILNDQALAYRARSDRLVFETPCEVMWWSHSGCGFGCCWHRIIRRPSYRPRFACPSVYPSVYLSEKK